MKKTVILGGRGMLGSDLAPTLAGAGCDVKILDLPECDITRPDHLEQALSGAGVVINCAAFTNVDMAEDQPERARAVNAGAVAELGAQARRHGVFVAHISTDFVFDGAGDRPWREDAIPCPISVYGRTKLAGEQALQNSGCAHLIMRVQWSYGRHGANFISKILERARAGAALKIVNDQVGAPTWTRDMADALAVLLAKRREGLFHFANTEYASRFDTACFILDRFKLSNPVMPCRTGEFPARAARPLNSRFDVTRISVELERPIRSWRAALDEYLAEYPPG